MRRNQGLQPVQGEGRCEEGNNCCSKKTEDCKEIKDWIMGLAVTIFIGAAEVLSSTEELLLDGSNAMGSVGVAQWALGTVCQPIGGLKASTSTH